MAIPMAPPAARDDAMSVTNAATINTEAIQKSFGAIVYTPGTHQQSDVDSYVSNYDLGVAAENFTARGLGVTQISASEERNGLTTALKDAGVSQPEIDKAVAQLTHGLTQGATSGVDKLLADLDYKLA